MIDLLNYYTYFHTVTTMLPFHQHGMYNVLGGTKQEDQWDDVTSDNFNSVQFEQLKVCQSISDIFQIIL